MSTQNSTFREDINGLRAWAVSAVVFYHFGITGFSGGFVGVDVFFVISGFLMAGIIISGLEKNRGHGGGGIGFSLIQFYLSRARRILPALIALCLFTLAIGWFFLSPIEYKALGTHVVSALGFLSNIMFWREAGYFDAASHEKLLLHTWSLSVEWQFYMILPIILLVIWKILPGRTMLTVMMALGFLLSLLLSSVLSPIKASAAFYLLPTRAWEMLAGGLVYLLANPLPLSATVRKGIEASGFALIIASIALFDAGTVWPGWQALLPVAGTMLVLIAARQGSLWTGGRIAQWLGNCSYSLYLWHWPFAVMLVYLELQGHPGAIAVGLLLTLLSGWLSYRLIEIPARNGLARIPQWHGAGALAATAMLVALPGLVIYLKQGMPERLPEHVRTVFDESKNRNPKINECHSTGIEPVPGCTHGGADLGAIIIGDSHALSLVTALSKSLPSDRQHILALTISGCPTINSIRHVDGRNCTSSIEKIKRMPEKKSTPIIIVNRFSYYTDGANEMPVGIQKPFVYIKKIHKSFSDEFRKEILDGYIETACMLSGSGDVYMLRPIPELKKDVPKSMARALLFGTKREVSIYIDEYRERNLFAWKIQDVAAEKCGVKILDPLPYLCSEGRCKGDKDGIPIYSDDDHLSERGGSLLIPMFRQVFEDVIQESTTSTAANKALAEGSAGTL